MDKKEIVASFYSIYVPEKISDLDDILKHFENRETDLFRTLEVKYDVKFSTTGMCVPNGADKIGEVFTSTGKRVDWDLHKE